MERQKICIIGGGLSGLITAVALSKLNLKVDLISNIINRDIKSSRTVAISQNSYDFLKKLEIFKFSSKDFWPCKKIKLYDFNDKGKIREIFDLNKSKNKNEEIFYMVRNFKLIDQILKFIKKSKLISLKKEKTIYEISNSEILKKIKSTPKKKLKYNLVIVCTGGNSNLVKKLFPQQSAGHSYKEVSITAILKHNSFENNTARQIFLKDGVFAHLPISKDETSVVWSVNKKSLDQIKDYKNIFIKKRINFYLKEFVKNIKFISKIEHRDLFFSIRKKYFKNRILLFGDALHLVHPLTGQGFNMVIRDLNVLQKILKQKINLGLDIGSYDILSEYSDIIQPRNFIYSLGIDFVKKSFSIKNKNLEKIRNTFIHQVNKNNFTKSIFLNIADKGLRF